MAIIKFLDLDGLAEVANYVNQKLRKVTEMPVTSTLNDIVLYNGPTTSNYKQGGIYLYTAIKTYYKWNDSLNSYYTDKEIPNVGDIVYSDTTGTDSGYLIEAYNSSTNQVTINSSIYDRDSEGDTIVLGWVRKNSSVKLEVEDTSLIFDLDE